MTRTCAHARPYAHAPLLAREITVLSTQVSQRECNLRIVFSQSQGSFSKDESKAEALACVAIVLG
eukprot:5982834-Pleurochrysis_carterae.AAC.1